MKRFLAHRIIFGDKSYPMSVVTLSEDMKTVEISPFAHESEATVFVSGTIVIKHDKTTGRHAVMHNDRILCK